MLDKALILRKISELDEYLKQIKEFSEISLQDYSEDWKVQRIVERTLQILVEVCADIANHIISDRGYRIPKSYADTFKVLYENDLLDKDLFETMEKMAKLRNILVHHYDKIDEAIVIGILKEYLNAFTAYKDAILRELTDKS